MTEKAKEDIHNPGKPWTTVGVFDSYENAQNQIMHLIAAAPTYDFKIRRSGDGGSQFTIKKRLNPELDQANQRMEEKLKKISETKASNKKKK